MRHKKIEILKIDGSSRIKESFKDVKMTFLGGSIIFEVNDSDGNTIGSIFNISSIESYKITNN